MILSLIIFVFLVMLLSFGNTDCLLNSLTFILPWLLLCFRNLSRWVSCSFYKYSWSSFGLLYPTSRYFLCFFWIGGRWTGWWQTTPLWAWVPCSYFAWRFSTRCSTLSLNPGKIHSCTFTWLSLLHYLCYTPRASHLSWCLYWPFIANCDERITWCIIKKPYLGFGYSPSWIVCGLL